ncbi:MAG: type II toxin-antitoxin system RelE/ParE family toxin [Deltaproteobacteria bacterium]|nr:type II toxin-antitoxin system RelE/ParE family toxin [Deltaproteobacteria bacterium]
MDIREREIRLYVTRSGKVPYSQWLNSLKDIRARAVIRVRLNRIRLGNFGDCKSVREGVMELRIDYGPGYRVYFGRIGRQIVLLLCGGDKSSQSKDIEQAQAYWADYRRREDGDE